MAQVELAKSINEDKRLFTAIVLRPDDIDSHGDTYSHEVVEQAAHDFMKYCQNTNLQHMFDVEKSDINVVESYIAPADMKLGEGEVIKGDWIMSVRVNDDTIWDMCKNGTFTGFSVGCSGSAIILEDDDDQS